MGVTEEIKFVVPTFSLRVAIGVDVVGVLSVVCFLKEPTIVTFVVACITVAEYANVGRLVASRIHPFQYFALRGGDVMCEVERGRFAHRGSVACPKRHRVVLQGGMRAPVASHVEKLARSHVVEEVHCARVVVGAVRGDTRLELIKGLSW